MGQPNPPRPRRGARRPRGWCARPRDRIRDGCNRLRHPVVRGLGRSCRLGLEPLHRDYGNLHTSPASVRREDDLRGSASSARSVGARTLADNTFATPINQRPIRLGVDAVLHSATKYIGGHSDVVAGAVVAAKAELFDRIWFTYKMLGPTLGPFEAFLVRRGLKTLPLRMRVHESNAQALAEFLEAHRAVRVVHYPGLPSFPQHALAGKQMSGYGGMLSFELSGGYSSAKAFVESVRVATLAVSLGGAETLVQHPASMTHGPLTDAERRVSGVTEGLVRVSVGLEDADDLTDDFDASIRKASRSRRSG